MQELNKKLDQDNGTIDIAQKPIEAQVVPSKESEPAHEKMIVETPASGVAETVQGIRSFLTRSKQKSKTIPIVRDAVTTEVEHIMEEGLKEAFVQLPVTDRELFKIRGEETAYKIRELLRSTHIKIKKIFALLMDWLKMLPGVNRFFLEQEAKIKADKILALASKDVIQK